MLQKIIDIRQQMRVAIGETDAVIRMSHRHGIQGGFQSSHPLLHLLIVIIIAVVQCAIRAATIAAATLAQVAIREELCACGALALATTSAIGLDTAGGGAACGQLAIR